MMGDEHDDDGPERFRAYVEAKQRNIDWPDTLRNGSSIDGFLWKGSTHLTGIQRAGIWIFGILFLFASLGLALVAWEQHSGLAILPVAFGLFIAARLIRNACRRNSPHPRDEEF
jgi:hypothetical protein